MSTDSLSVKILQALSIKGVSDVLVCPEQPVMIKTPEGWAGGAIGGVPDMGAVGVFLDQVDAEWMDRIKEGAINRPFLLGDYRLRIHAYLAFNGSRVMLAIRPAPIALPTLQQAGLPPFTRMMLQESGSGIILVSGATGSGKTTSMAAMVGVINETRSAHIVMIEDPIEFLFTPKRSVFSQREIGVDCGSFSIGIKDAMRERPDVIVIGEIRDRDTMEQCILAGESGHLVIGTIHAGSAAGTITKALGFFGKEDRESKLQSMAANLVGVIHQTLIPCVAGGSVLAFDFMANHRRQYSRFLGEPDKVSAMLDRKEDGVSVGFGESLLRHLDAGVITKGAAVRAAMATGSAAVYEKLKDNLSGAGRT